MFKKIFIFTILLLCSLAYKAEASSVFLSLPQKVEVGRVFEVLISADTGSELINGSKISLRYDPTFLEFSGYKSEGTVLNLWIEAPHAEKGTVYFSGIVPGGVLGLFDPNKNTPSPIPLTKIIFIAKAPGETTLSFADSELLKHDGAGTSLPHDSLSSSLIIEGSINNEDIENKVFDTDLPQNLEINFLESGFFSRTPSMISFSATDHTSGIKEYKLKIKGLGWHKIVSPYPVTKGLFPYTLAVRAYDFAGNFSESEVRIPGLLTYQMLAPGIILLALCFVVIRVIKLKL